MTEDEFRAILRAELQKALDERLGPPGNCGIGCNMGKCGRADCSFPIQRLGSKAMGL